ncbi:MAG TPA: exodeoxyribonuclease VII small subunit [bacterium]|nr:exodeoxyribonuclease VII small subunit [bacterium]HPN32537.1 exodeoxyribonuclease VII small subunit [bacterium]
MKNEKFNFEEGINSLENIVKKLESPDTGLDESIEIYKKGMDILNKCNKKLEEAELQIVKLTKSENKNENPEEV